MKAMLTTVVAVFVAMAAAEAQTVKVWKWVDRDGRVTYSEDPPPAAARAQRVEEKQFDPNEITVQTTPAPASQTVTNEAPAPAPTAASEEAVQAAARERLLERAAGAAEAEAAEREAAATGGR